MDEARGRDRLSSVKDGTPCETGARVDGAGRSKLELHGVDGAGAVGRGR